MITRPLAQKTFKMDIRNAIPQVIAVMVKNCLMLSFGMNLGFSTILIGGVLDKSTVEFDNVSEYQVSWLGSTTLLTVLIGSLFSGITTQPLGRKRSMQFITIPFILCWIGFFFSDQIWHLYFLLAVMGLFGGLVEAPFTAYVSEVTQPYIRGILSTTGSISVVIGVLIQFLNGTFNNWRTCALISCVFPLITLILFCFIPESPYWLLLNHKIEEAKKNLAWLRGWTTVDNIKNEIDDMLEQYNIKVNSEENLCEPNSRKCFNFTLNSHKYFLKKNFFWPLALVTFMFILTSFTGANTLQTYALSIFTTLKVPINAYHATIFLAITQLVGALVSAAIIHVIGKRLMVFLSLMGVCLCNILIATYAYIIDARYIILVTSTETTDTDNSNWLPFILLLLLSFIDHCGNYIAPWVLIGEIFSYETRLVACGLSTSVSYLLNFISNNLFLRMVSSITIPGMYYFHAIISLIGLIVLYFTLPETEGKTLEAIADHFKGVSKLGNNIERRKSIKSQINGIDNLSFDTTTAL